MTDHIYSEFLLPKPHRYKCKRYLAFIARQKCIVCQSREVQVAHIGPKGTGSKVSDFRTLPICAKHHLTGHDSIHRHGEEQFEVLFAVDLKELMIQHMIRFMAEELGIADA